MPYGPNTSRTSRLPHGFYERAYEKIHRAQDMIQGYENGHPPTLEQAIELLRAMTEDLARQRSSHLGNETL